MPCYVLFRIEGGRRSPEEWLLLSWVPEGAKVRLKMLYASSRDALKKEFGWGISLSISPSISSSLWDCPCASPPPRSLVMPQSPFPHQTPSPNDPQALISSTLRYSNVACEMHASEKEEASWAEFQRASLVSEADRLSVMSDSERARLKDTHLDTVTVKTSYIHSVQFPRMTSISCPAPSLPPRHALQPFLKTSHSFLPVSRDRSRVGHGILNPQPRPVSDEAKRAVSGLAGTPGGGGRFLLLKIDPAKETVELARDTKIVQAHPP